MVQSSSPSYPVMASLDLARRLVHSQGPAAFTAGLAAVDILRRGLAGLPRYRLVQPPADGGAAYLTQDPFKIVIYDAAGVLSGPELQRRLEERGCVPEMSDERHVVLLFSLGSRAEDAARLLEALQDIDLTSAIPVSSTENFLKSHDSTWNNYGNNVVSAPVKFSLKPAKAEDKETISLRDSLGRVAAEMVIPYPPGIPLLYPGETINRGIYNRLTALARTGAKFQASADPALQSIVVYNIQKGGEA